jgi:hypothetical protein
MMTGEEPFTDPKPHAGRRLVDQPCRLGAQGAACVSEAACVVRPVVAILIRGVRTAAKRAAKRDQAGAADMKVNIEIDCTPLEARQFIGLPDVQPMQTAVMDRLQNQMLSNIEKVSPEALMQSWFTFDPKLAERFQDMFVTMAGLGTRSSDKKK